MLCNRGAVDAHVTLGAQRLAELFGQRASFYAPPAAEPAAAADAPAPVPTPPPPPPAAAQAPQRPAAPHVTAIGPDARQLLSGAKYGLRATPPRASGSGLGSGLKVGTGLHTQSPMATGASALDARGPVCKQPGLGNQGLPERAHAEAGSSAEPVQPRSARGSAPVPAAARAREGTNKAPPGAPAAGPRAGSGATDRAAARRSQAATDRAHNAAVLAGAAGDEAYARRVAEEQAAQAPPRDFT